MVSDTERMLLEVADYYRLPRDQIEERHWAKMKAILQAKTLPEAVIKQKTAVESLRMSCIHQTWYTHKIQGPATPEYLEVKAKKAESLAKWQENLGNDEAAKKQRERAEKFRKEAHELLKAKQVEVVGKPFTVKRRNARVSKKPCHPKLMRKES